MSNRFLALPNDFMIVDTQHQIPSIIYVNEWQKQKFLDGLNELSEKSEHIKEIFDRAVERTYDKYMDSPNVEKALDYMQDCFYDLLKEGLE